MKGKSLILAVLLVALLAGGCGKKESGTVTLKQREAAGEAATSLKAEEATPTPAATQEISLPTAAATQEAGSDTEADTETEEDVLVTAAPATAKATPTSTPAATKAPEKSVEASAAAADSECTHTQTETRTVQATCTTDGEESVICSACKAVLSTKVLPCTGHSYEGTVIEAATATKAGMAKYTCTRCGDSYEETIPRLSNAGETPEDPL